jgi:hypothetical protein
MLGEYMRVYWDDDEKTILIRELASEWTWDDYQLSILAMRQMILEVKHEIFVIIDGRPIKKLPKDALHHFQAGNRKLPPQVKMRLLVSTNKLSHEIYSILRRISAADFENFHFVPSIEDAYQKIEAQKLSLSS